MRGSFTHLEPPKEGQAAVWNARSSPKANGSTATSPEPDDAVAGDHRLLMLNTNTQQLGAGRAPFMMAKLIRMSKGLL